MLAHRTGRRAVHRGRSRSTACADLNPFPQWFGFHEVFHAFTVIAFAAHYAGVSIATYTLR